MTMRRSGRQRGWPVRSLSRQSSASTVPMPVRMASLSWRSSCTWARARSLVIQPRLSSGAEILPSSVMAVLRVTRGRPVRMKWRKGSLSFSASAANSVGIFDFDAGLAEFGEALSGDQRVRVGDGRDDARHAGQDQRVHAGRSAALVRAGLQVEIEGGAARLLAGLREGDDFGVVEPGVSVEAAADHFALAHQDGAHQGVGTGQRPAFARQVERFAHVLSGHFSKSDSMNFSESKGSRSSAFSPTPM